MRKSIHILFIVTIYNEFKIYLGVTKWEKLLVLT